MEGKESSSLSNGPRHMDDKTELPQKSTEAVLKDSAPIPDDVPEVGGIDFDDYKDHDMTVTELLLGMENMGFQASEQNSCLIFDTCHLLCASNLSL